MAIELYGFPGSTYTRTARIVCEEKAADYRLHPLDFGAPSHLALHPFAKMPAMKDGDVHLFEAIAIAVYVDDTVGKPALQPGDAAGRAQMWQWVSAAIDYFYDAFVRTLLSHGDAAGPVPEARVSREQCLAALVATLERTDHLAGPSLTLADLLLAPMLDYYSASAEGEGKIRSAAPSVADWLDRLTARDSFMATAS